MSTGAGGGEVQREAVENQGEAIDKTADAADDEHDAGQWRWRQIGRKIGLGDERRGAGLKLKEGQGLGIAR